MIMATAKAAAAAAEDEAEAEAPAAAAAAVDEPEEAAGAAETADGSVTFSFAGEDKSIQEKVRPLDTVRLYQPRHLRAKPEKARYVRSSNSHSAPL